MSIFITICLNNQIFLYTVKLRNIFKLFSFILLRNYTFMWIKWLSYITDHTLMFWRIIFCYLHYLREMFVKLLNLFVFLFTVVIVICWRYILLILFIWRCGLFWILIALIELPLATRLYYSLLQYFSWIITFFLSFIRTYCGAHFSLFLVNIQYIFMNF